MAELHTTVLRNTDGICIQTGDDDSTIRRVLADIERLMAMLSNENKYPVSSNLINLSPQTSLCCLSSITSVTVTDDNYRLIEHLRNRIARLEHERNVLLTSYQLLIKLLK